MVVTSKQWQMRIKMVCQNDNWEATDQVISVFGETVDALQKAVRAHLLKNEPNFSFSNVGDHITGFVEYTREFFTSTNSTDEDILQEHWRRKEIKMHRGQMQEEQWATSSEMLESFEEAVDDFVKTALIPEKGPAYHSKALFDDHLRLPLLEKVLRETEEYTLNDLIQRGWQIIALEYKGELSMTGELMERKAIFVLGHPETQAALLTINSSPYSKK